MAEETKLESRLDVTAARFTANRSALLALLGGMREQEAVIRQGGGAKAVEAQHAKGRLTVRERLALLLDEGTEFLELGLWVAGVSPGAHQQEAGPALPLCVAYGSGSALGWWGFSTGGVAGFAGRGSGSV